jgi:hypothetical protein
MKDHIYVIDLNKLQFGDIILSRDNGGASVAMRAKTKSNFSHAMIYTGRCYSLESDMLGVNSVNPQRLSFETSEDAFVFRLKNVSNVAQLAEGLNYASTIVGMAYASKREVLKSLSPTDDAALEIRRQFCTRFVAQIYDRSGLPIVSNPDYCTPLDIEKSEQLERISILREGTPKEIELAKEEFNVISYQAEVTHKFLFEVQQVSSIDIQTFDEVDEYLKTNPHKDAEINKLLKESGYLKLGIIESEENPHFYDEVKFIEYFDFPAAIDFSVSQLLDEMIRNYNYEIAANRYKEMAEVTSLTYFDSLAKCYARQKEFSDKRLSIFRKFSLIYLSQGNNNSNPAYLELVTFVIHQMVKEKNRVNKRVFKQGDSVRHFSNGQIMEIKDFEVDVLKKIINKRRAICVWKEKGKQKTEIFWTYDLVHNDPLFIYTGGDSYDNIV